MAIQIFGSKKNNDSKKAERFFKDRNIKVQYVDMKEKGLSKGELTSVIQAVKGIDEVLDPNCKDQDALALVKYISEDEKLGKLLANQQVLKLPIVRNGKQATVGYQPDIWKSWV